jgi:alkylhydroperoxidase family enzyme
MTMSDFPPPPGPPRIPPLSPDEYTDKARAFFSIVEGPGGRSGGTKLNIVQTLAQHPDLAVPYFNFGRYIINSTTVPPRLREIVTLRAAWLYKSDYEWSQHAATARRIGIPTVEIDAVKVGVDAPVWSKHDRHVLRAMDQLYADASIDDETWAGMAEHLDQRQLLDLLFIFGSYAMLAMVLNAVRVEKEAAG